MTYGYFDGRPPRGGQERLSLRVAPDHYTQWIGLHMPGWRAHLEEAWNIPASALVPTRKAAEAHKNGERQGPDCS